MLTLIQPGNPPDPQGEPVTIAAVWILVLVGAAFGVFLYYKKIRK